MVVEEVISGVASVLRSFNSQLCRTKAGYLLGLKLRVPSCAVGSWVVVVMVHKGQTVVRVMGGFVQIRCVI